MRTYISDYSKTREKKAKALILSFLHDTHKEDAIARNLPMNMLTDYYKIYPSIELIMFILKHERMKLLVDIIKTDTKYIKTLVSSLEPDSRRFIESLSDLETYERNHFILGLTHKDTDKHLKLLYCMIDLYAQHYKEDKDFMLNKFAETHEKEECLSKNLMNYIDQFAEEVLGE